MKGYWARRLEILLIIAVVAGLTAGISTLLSHGTQSGAATLGPPIIPGAGRTVVSQTLSPNGFTINTTVAQGLGCTGQGAVYPLRTTPTISTHVRPGSGPKYGGSTWDQNPSAFGAVPAGPLTVAIAFTGPKGHALTVTGLTVHVLSRKPQVVGPWLNRAQGCGSGAASYHSGIADLDGPAPYYLHGDALPGSVRADPLTFPHVATAQDPEGLRVTVRTEHCDCVWNATLTWTDGGRQESTVIDDHGHPFETTSVTGKSGVDWYNASTSGAPGAWLTKPLTPA